jgi:hypothetical protein
VTEYEEKLFKEITEIDQGSNKKISTKSLDSNSEKEIPNSN